MEASVDFVVCPAQVDLPSAKSRWEHIAAQKQSERNRAIRAWSEITLSRPDPLSPPSSVTNVVRWPLESGQLSDRQAEITECIPSRLLERLSSGEWTAEEVLLAFIARATIAHHLTNPLTEVFFDHGIERARELDMHLKKTGRTVGPLHGLPMSLKDVMNVKGLPTTLGYVALATREATSSDELVKRIAKAGAVFYCKTNVPQTLMSGECNNFLYGRTTSPHNTTLSAGGSSGGEGSLIALGGSPLGIGTDIAGSIRTPANFNGIYGLCPTSGRLPLHSPELSTPYYQIRPVAGPLSRSIDGLEIYTRTVLGMKPWQWDFQCDARPWDEGAYQEVKELAAARDLCIGFVANDGVVTPHPPIQRGMHEVKDALRRAGVRIFDVDLFDGTEKIWESMTGIFNASGDKAVRELLGILHEPVTPEAVLPRPEDVLSVDELFGYGKQLYRVRQQLLERWQRTAEMTGTGRPVDFFVMPSGGHLAPPHGTMEYFTYEAVSNAIDTTCATIPVGTADRELDAAFAYPAGFEPLSKADERNWKKYTPEAYQEAPICLQVMGPRFSEEKTLACLRVIDQALGRTADHVMR